ncbi:hypothetical protein FJT64_026269 [Amphibalanus amphitrite]|uniref:Uncharacterized protein n=1 Tax=Amphibalanus amphitrite TaxID=1232801 RepID=A0A6A4W894_AMPAM|nr:hypothetical protein FJT64_026269 [Amphibalanus amphitrite]
MTSLLRLALTFLGLLALKGSLQDLKIYDDPAVAPHHCEAFKFEMIGAGVVRCSGNLRAARIARRLTGVRTAAASSDCLVAGPSFDRGVRGSGGCLVAGPAFDRGADGSSGGAMMEWLPRRRSDTPGRAELLARLLARARLV